MNQCQYCEYKALLPDDLTDHKIMMHAEEYYGRKNV